jgi:hypothetical protein
MLLHPLFFEMGGLALALHLVMHTTILLHSLKHIIIMNQRGLRHINRGKNENQQEAIVLKSFNMPSSSSLEIEVLCDNRISLIQ